MIETIRRLLDFSGRCRTDLLCAFGYGVLYSVSEVIPVLAIVVALEAVLSPSGGGWFAVAASGGLMGLSVAGKIIFGKRATERRMLASYDMCADKRIEVGEILKRVPLGYFSQNRLGELTATLTTTLGEIETNAVAILDKVANGFVHAVAITLLISWYDWHAGLITAAGLVVSLFVYGAMQRKGRKLSPVRQAAQSRLVAAVLEYVQGMAVVKAFGLGDRSNRAVDEAIEACRASNTDLERSFSTLAAAYQLVFKVAAFGVLLVFGAAVPERRYGSDQMPAAHGFELHAVRAHRNDGQRFRAVPRHFRSAGSHGSPEECPASGRARGRFRAGVLRHPHGGCGVFLRRDAPPRRDQSCDPAGDDHRDRRAFRQRRRRPCAA